MTKIIQHLYRCLGCGLTFRAYPGPDVECPQCQNMYVKQEKGA